MNVGPDEIVTTERQFFGAQLKPGRVFAFEGEVGINLKHLSPGLHWIAWPFIKVAMRSKFVTIGPEEMGLVEAVDGEQLPSGPSVSTRIFSR